ncbi:hypothetical protein S40288_07845 [Stachybotrys chartarum IBT 40288]|nr:hypothetical protein S40288_07845 [Stachybotrys chartarum IBT 40288]
MAFQQPTRQPVQRPVHAGVDVNDTSSPAARPYSEDRPLDSQTWVLFAPATDTTTISYLTETEHSLRTNGPTRTGDRGTEGRDPKPESTWLSAHDDDTVEDDGELDSLDSHLPEFRSTPDALPIAEDSPQNAIPILPNHDGLGSFRLDRPAIGTDAQDQIYQFERFNPRRTHRPRDSLERVHLEQELEQQLEQAHVAEKRQRIEAWRLEHSRILLEEVQRETKRRRKSQASPNQTRRPETVSASRSSQTDFEQDNTAWHDEDAIEQQDDNEGFVASITRKVIQDVFGLDDRLLSVLFGETIPDDDDLSTTPRASQLNFQQPTSQLDESWHLRMLDRVSRELGLLVNRLSQHPGAFSTYAQVQQMPIPYAGLPVIPESTATSVVVDTADNVAGSKLSMPEFRPTMDQHPRAINVPGRRAEVADESTSDVRMKDAFTQEEWEQDLDIKLVFRYLRSRFTSRSTTAPPVGTPHHVPPSVQDMAAKTARVRQHHPLTARSRPAERRTFKAAPSSPVAARHHSSCASQSTRRSARRSSGSSRHYWDIGGSLGTGSMIASNGPMGSWGEV